MQVERNNSLFKSFSVTEIHHKECGVAVPIWSIAQPSYIVEYY